MESSHESMVANILGHVQEEVTREREDGRLLRAPGYGASLELKYLACNFSAVCKEVTDLCRNLRTSGKWEEAGMSYVAQISVYDSQVDEQDFRALAVLISALKASSMSSLRVANCGLTSEVAGLLFFHLFSTPVHWTRLDISHNRHFCFPESRFALECFDYFVRRNPLRVLKLNHTGFTNAHIQGILGKLHKNASSKRYLRILKIGPPVSGQNCGGSRDPEAEQLDLQTSQDLCSLLASHHSLQLLVVWGTEGELVDTIVHAGLQAGLQREETETGCLRLKRLDFQDAEEHFRKFDANILQSVMDVQEEAPAVEDPPAINDVGPRHERARLDHHYNAERPATHRRAPLRGVSHGFVVPLVHRQRGHGKSKSRRDGTHRRPSNRGAGADPNVAEVPRKRRRHGPIVAHAAPHGQGAGTNGTGTGSRTLARKEEGANASWDGAHNDPASQSYGEELGTSGTGSGTDSEDYSSHAHEQLHITRLEVGQNSGDPPNSPGEDMHMRSAGRGMSPAAAAATPLAPLPLGPPARSPPSAWQPDRQQPNHDSVADGSPAHAPRHRRRKTPSTPASPLRIPKDLVPFGFESRQSAEKHPPRGVFAAPDGPKRTRRRPAQALAALEVLRQQRRLTVQHSCGSHTDNASDSLPSGSEPDQDEDADSSDPESLLAAVQPIRIRRLQIPDSEDQEQAQVLATDILAHAGEEEAGQGMHAHSAGSERWVAPEQQASPRQPSPALDKNDDEDSPGGSSDSAHRRALPVGAAAANGSQDSGLSRVQLHEEGEVDSSEHEAVSEDPAMKRRRKGSSAVDGDMDERAQPSHGEDALQQGPVVQDLVAKQHNSAVSIPSLAKQEPAQAVQRTARARRSEMERLMPFSWDKYLEKHPPNTEKLGVLMAESRDRRRPARFSAARGIESGSPDDEDDPEDNIPLVKIRVPATKQSTGAANAATPQDYTSGAAAQLVTGNPLTAGGASCAMQNTPSARSEPATTPNPGGALVECMHPQLPRAQSPMDNKALDSCKPDTASSSDDNAELRGAPSSVSGALASAGVAACDVLLNPGGKELSCNNEMDDLVPDSEDEM